MTEARTRGTPRRLTALDGLRGVAALVVVVCHVVDATPALINARHGSVGWWAWFSPTSLLWNGDAAVVVFFVLSGFVLARPFLGPRNGRWRGYYPRRLLRLYLPLWGALAFTFLTTVVAPRHAIAGATFWTNNHHQGPAGYVLSDGLLPHTGDAYNDPLWSLRWEILFSLFLPLYVVGARTFRRFRLARVGTVLAVVALAGADAKVGSLAASDAIVYMSTFAVGVLIAAFEAELVTRMARMWKAARSVRVTTVACCAALLDAEQVIYPLRGRLPNWSFTLAHAAEIAGAGLAILLALSWPRLERALDSPGPAWLGTRSFSLYLVHDPVLISLLLLLGGHPNPLVLLCLTVPLSLAVAAAFHALVERPSHRLANWVGRALDTGGAQPVRLAWAEAAEGPAPAGLGD